MAEVGEHADAIGRWLEEGGTILGRGREQMPVAMHPSNADAVIIARHPHGEGELK
jgi:hypothetical protein